MTLKAVIFYLDGTLVDSAPDLMLATNHVLARLELHSSHKIFLLYLLPLLKRLLSVLMMLTVVLEG